MYHTILYNKSIGTWDYLFPSRATLHELELQHEIIPKAHVSRLIVQFDNGKSLESISETEHLLLPVLLRVFLKSYLNVDSMTVQGYLQNPSLIPNERLRDTVGCVVFVSPVGDAM